MNIIEHYTETGEVISTVLNETLNKSDLDLLASNHHFIEDLALWAEVLYDRPELNILKNAIKEYQISILNNIIGFYQTSFNGLRFFLERTLTAILFSAKEIELNLWKLGERDTYWAEVMDDNEGVFSNKFCKAFFPELKEEILHFKEITKKAYRECAEYSHGNQHVIEKIPETLAYSQQIFMEWNQKADTIKRIILFTLCLRYLRDLSKDRIKKIENSLYDEFNSIKPIIAIIES